MMLFFKIISGVLAVAILLVLLYMLVKRFKKEPDTRPEEIEAWAVENGWRFAHQSEPLETLIQNNRLEYMGETYRLRNVCVQERDDRKIYLFDGLTETGLSGIVVKFEQQAIPPFYVVERLIENRLQTTIGTVIEPDKLPKFVEAKVSVYAAAEHHAEVCTLIDQHADLQTLFKRRDIGYVCLCDTAIAVYLLTRYPADERGFAKLNQRVDALTQLFNDEHL